MATTLDDPPPELNSALPGPRWYPAPAWHVPKAVLIGHSYGTDSASRFCLTHSDRVAAMMLMCGPFVGDWRTGDRAERRRRMSAAQQERLRDLEELPHRAVEQEVELLTLAWFTDHSDPERGWHWAAQGARRRRPSTGL
ncbi:alpha/beta fold hydrolase [Streptomyces sp. NPDC005794]|uniref:alpha/beta fold hydrolase n=1 Tax=Streptomyces sp. NPDC005794 TaxID=3364733 RepID=UPI0036A5F176